MKKIITILLSAAIIASVLSGCGQNNASVNSGTMESQTQSETAVQTNIEEITAVEFTKEEQDASYNESSATKIVFSNNSPQVTGSGASVSQGVVTITAGGEYIISGSSTNGQIIVNSSDKNTVKIVLNGVDITCTDSAPIYIQQAEKTIITLAAGTENKISDGENYILNQDEEPSAAIFSKDDLVINGSGSLTVTANYNDGITGKDTVKIISGTIKITAKDDGIVGKDLLAVMNGNITIDSQGKGLKSSNTEDSAKGVIYIQSGNITITSADDGINSSNLLQIDGGTLEINAEDDGIHTDTYLVVNSGDINILKSYEGIESNKITINDGNINLYATDDGINISSSDDSTEFSMPRANSSATSSNNILTINGGYIVVNAAGDGIDINGSAYMNGGTVIVNGPTNSGNGALDHDGEFVVNGGTLIAAGSLGMAQALSQNSTVYSVSIGFDTVQKANTIIHIQDAQGNDIITFAPAKEYQSVVVASSLFENGATYSIYTGGSVKGEGSDGLYSAKEYTGGTLQSEFTISSTVTNVGNATGFGGLGGGKDFGGKQGNMPFAGGETNSQMPQQWQAPDTTSGATQTVPEGFDAQGQKGNRPQRPQQNQNSSAGQSTSNV